MSKIAKDLIASRALPAHAQYEGQAQAQGVVARRGSAGARAAAGMSGGGGGARQLDASQYITVLKQRLDEQKKELEDRTVAINSVQRNFESLSEMYSHERNTLQANARRAQELEEELKRLKMDLATNYLPKKEYLAVETELQRVKDTSQAQLAHTDQQLQKTQDDLARSVSDATILRKKLAAAEKSGGDAKNILSDAESAVYDCENALKTLLDLLEVSTTTLYADVGPPPPQHTHAKANASATPLRTNSGRLLRTTAPTTGYTSSTSTARRPSGVGPSPAVTRGGGNGSAVASLNAPSGFVVPTFRRDTNDWEALKCLPVSSRVLAVAEGVQKLSQAASLPSVFAFCGDMVQQARADMQDVWDERTQLQEDLDALQKKYRQLETAVMDADAEKANASRALTSQKAVKDELAAALAEQAEKVKQLEGALKAAQRNVEEKVKDAAVLVDQRDAAIAEAAAVREEHRALWEEYRSSRDTFRSSEAEWLRALREREADAQKELRVLQDCHRAELTALRRSGDANHDDLSRKEAELQRVLEQGQAMEHRCREIERAAREREDLAAQRRKDEEARMRAALEQARSEAFDFKEALASERQRDQRREAEWEARRNEYLVEAESVEVNKKRLEDAVARLTQLLTASQDECEALKAQLQTSTASAGDKHAAAAALQRTLSKRDSELGNVRADLAACAADLESRTAELAEAQVALAETQAALAAAEEGTAAAAIRINSLEDANTRLQRAVDAATADGADGATQLQEERAANATLASRVAELEAALAVEQQAVVDVKEKLAVVEGALGRADRQRAQQVAALESKVDDLTQRNAELDGEVTARINELREFKRTHSADANAQAELERLKASLASERRAALETKKKQEEVDKMLGDLKMVQAETAKTLRKLMASEESSESAYTCLACFGIMEEATLCNPCGHTFCAACMDAASRKASRHGEAFCPECDECCVSSTTPLKALDLLVGRYTYRKQVLHDLESALLTSTGRRQSLQVS